MNRIDELTTTWFAQYIIPQFLSTVTACQCMWTSDWLFIFQIPKSTLWNIQCEIIVRIRMFRLYSSVKNDDKRRKRGPVETKFIIIQCFSAVIVERKKETARCAMIPIRVDSALSRLRLKSIKSEFRYLQSTIPSSRNYNFPYLIEIEYLPSFSIA